MNALQPWHLIILVLVVVVLFGAKRLPDAARSIGKSMKVFKAETKDLRGEQSDQDSGESDATTSTTTTSTTTPDAKQISTPTVKADAEVTDATSVQSADVQVEQLQRQLDELKQQQSAEQAQKNG
ncbi:sec-independent protein translocase protein TatA [Prauserella isguenensis]|uniref:Sec-independent protein translocase protein TatA n=1 Tax=Prauserella isguenensis TaxID=1470180 RepID=A0A839S2S3_9PSEU|nr:Sec-independent protein translocase subunit TatA [Prauserella isguenensis]MBB3051007.1 sec-independent protein translocase protein TatA [Prauserella isguenensis]